jgi:hypothetical protein
MWPFQGLPFLIIRPTVFGVNLHSIMIEPHELAQQHQLDMETPLLTTSKAVRCTRCTRCGARRGCCWPEPHDTRPGPGKENAGDGRGMSPGAGSASNLGGNRRWLGYEGHAQNLSLP